MAELKTKPTVASVEGFLNKLDDEQQREDALAVLKMMKKVTGMKPTMWGSGIIGFGHCHYKYQSGHEGDCCIIGFSPRKGTLSLYFMPGVEIFKSHLKKLGKHKTGKACLYVKKLSDIDIDVLRDMMEICFEKMQNPKKMYDEAMQKSKKRKKS
jgi:hypothetical protein